LCLRAACARGAGDAQGGGVGAAGALLEHASPGCADSAVVADIAASEDVDAGAKVDAGPDAEGCADIDVCADCGAGATAAVWHAVTAIAARHDDTASHTRLIVAPVS
jgi:hypothetical protein